LIVGSLEASVDDEVWDKVESTVGCAAVKVEVFDVLIMKYIQYTYWYMHK